MKSTAFSLKINFGLFFSGLVMVFSGLLIQIEYHIGNHGRIDINKAVWGLSHSNWSMIHKIFVIIFSFFMVYHIILHWRWFKTVITKNMITKNKLVITLSIVFLLIALTGFSPWLINLAGGDASIREVFIEIHDKIALILIVLLVFHIIKKLKWFKTALIRI